MGLIGKENLGTQIIKVIRILNLLNSVGLENMHF